MQAGEDTDVIVGMGYDNALGKKIGITLVATGFDAKNPFAKPVVAKKVIPQPEKIVMTLGVEGEEKKLTLPAPLPQATIPFIEVDPFAPRMQEETVVDEPIAILSATEKYLATLPQQQEQEVIEDANGILHFELSTTIPEAYTAPKPVTVDVPEEITATQDILQFVMSEKPMAPGILNKPSNIYAQAKPFTAWIQEEPKLSEPVPPTVEPIYTVPVFEAKQEVKDEEPTTFELHEKNIVPVEAVAAMPSDYADFDEAGDQRRRAQERIQKLRNLSFNINSNDSNNDFETVPAYIRQKMDLYGNAFTSAENFYSKYTVNKDEHNNTQISAINTFLDGKKPD